MWSHCCKPAFLIIHLSVFFWSHGAAGACSTCHWAGGEVHPGPGTKLHTERPQSAAVCSTRTTAPQCCLLLPQVAAKRTAPCGTSILASFIRPRSSSLTAAHAYDPRTRWQFSVDEPTMSKPEGRFVGWLELSGAEWVHLQGWIDWTWTPIVSWHHATSASAPKLNVSWRIAVLTQQMMSGAHSRCASCGHWGTSG